MTEEKIKQGQELLRTIKEVKDFLNVLNQVAGNKSGYAYLTLTAKAAVAAPSLTISKFPAITTAFAMAVCNELSKLEKEFEQL